MTQKYNAACSICGQRYHVCNACQGIKTQKPWRTVTDTAACYQIYMTLHGYANGAIRKEKARKMLHECVFPNTFQPHIRALIDEIMHPDGNA